MTRRLLAAAALVGAFASAMLHADGAQGGAGQHRDTNTGLSISHHGLSATNDVDGGSYLAAAVSRFLSDGMIADVTYHAEIAPESFRDHLVGADLMFRILNQRDYAMAIGPIYIKDLTAGAGGNYVGARVITYSSWKHDHRDRVNPTIDLLPFSFLYGIDSGDFLFAFSFVDIHVFF
jgi:hypothetical protein